MIQDLQQEEQDVSNIHCTGQYSFVVEKSVDKTPPTNTERNEQ